MTDSATLQACIDGLGMMFAPGALVLLVVGVAIGGLVGILPGLGGPATLVLLLPFVFDAKPEQAFALLMGVIAVTATTGDLTSILVGIPGEPTAAATVVDGHAMARQGSAGLAMGASLLSSLVGAVVGALALGVAIVATRPLLGALGSPELLMLAVLGVCCAMPLMAASRLRGVAAGALGLALATVGLDPITGTPRFTLGQMTLWDGVGLIPVSLGLFAIPEIASLASRSAIATTSTLGVRSFGDGMRAALERWRVVLRASAVGTAVGLVPGLGGSAAQWLAYADAARRQPREGTFGSGVVEGVIAPSAANNATLGGALVPMVALGIPGSLSAAMLLSALVMKGLVPGPAMLAPERDGGHLAFVYSLVWMIVAANVVAVGLTWLASRWLIRVTELRSSLLVPVLIVLVCVGAFAERHVVSDLFVTVAVGIVGVRLAQFNWPRAPLLLGVVLGPLAEQRLFLSIQAHGVSWWSRPGVVAIALLIVASVLYPVVRRRRTQGPVDQPLPPNRSEAFFIALLLVVCAAGLAATGQLPGPSALFPRFALVVAFVAMATLLVSGLNRQRAPAATRPDFDWVSQRSLAFVLLFVALIWLLGFSWGATLGVFVHLMTSERQRPAAVLSVTLATYLLVEVVMSRLLSISFPAGAVLALGVTR